MSFTSSIRERIKDSMDVSQQQGITIIVVIFIVVILIYFYNKIALREKNCRTIEATYNDEIKNGFGHIKMSSLTDDVSYNTYTDENNKTRRLKLKDMYERPHITHVVVDISRQIMSIYVPPTPCILWCKSIGFSNIFTQQ